MERERELRARLKEDAKDSSLTIHLNRLDVTMVDGTLYPISNITNSTKMGGRDAWLRQDRAYGQRWENWAYFTYTPSIAWAWRPQPAHLDGEDVLESLNVGCLDGEVTLGIGIDDMEQAFARAKAETLLQCLKACPGMKDRRSGDGQQAMMGFEREDELMRRDTENRDFLDVW